MDAATLSILYQDEHIVVVNKPHGLLVHRTKIAAGVDENALTQLRDQLDRYVYPAHRLDRKTAGCLVFSLSKEASREISALFAHHNITKTYWAIARGYTESSGQVDYPLLSENGVMQEAVTDYKTLAHAEIPYPLGKHATSRYSLVELYPTTGRMHQIRRHLNHLRHPIIGDRPHGCSKQNRFWKQEFGITSMFLHARSISFVHPFTKEALTVSAPLFEVFSKALDILNIQKHG